MMDQSLSAIVTGAASGIGREIANRLLDQGYSVTLLDLDAPALQQTALELLKGRPHVSVRTAVVDVTDAGAQQRAFREHAAALGPPKVVVLNAGIGERGPFFDAANTGWQKTLDVDLTAVLYGVRAAAEVMAGGGTILSVASAGAIYPMPAAPVYAAAKAGVAHFTRSAARALGGRAAPLRLLALCPEFVETPLVTQLMKEDPAKARQLLGRLDIALLSPAYVAGVAADMVAQLGRFKTGSVVLVRQSGEVVLPYARQSATIGGGGGKGGGSGGSGKQGAAAAAAAAGGEARERRRQALVAWALAGAPQEYKKIVITQLSSRFPEAARTAAVPLPPRLAPPPGSLLVRRVFAGINASDVNYSSGRYHASRAEAQAALPFDAGFESVSVVMAVGEGVAGFAPGDPVAALSYGAFSEYGIEPARGALPVPAVAREVVALLTSGLTASIALEEAGRMKAGETVLVTAAAGGTGQFAVQLAKAAGCRVVATCGGEAKAALLRELGADRVIDHTRESVKEVLRSEFPRGVDVVYESVGGDMFRTALDALAPRGRLIIIGMMSAYGSGWAPGSYPGLAEKLLWKSATAVGFFLLRHAPLWRPHLARLVGAWRDGTLRVATDPRVFVGLDSVYDAVQHLQSGASVGKVVVQIPERLPPAEAEAGGTLPAARL